MEGNKDMRQYFHKTNLLLTIFIMVSVLFSLCSIAIANGHRVKKILPFLSDDYAVIQNTAKEKIDLEKYFSAFQNVPKAYTVGVMFDDGRNRAVYSGDKRLEEISLQTGRIFRADDYDTHADVVLIREDLKELCNEVEGKLVYRYQGKDFQVIGVYKDRNHSSVSSAKCIFNLCAKSLRNYSDWSFGFFDVGKESLSVVGDLDSFRKLGIGYYSVESEKGNVFYNVGDNLKLMLILYIGVAFIIFLNVFSATNNWLSGKQREIAIRKMVGACKSRIYIWLTGNFMSLVLLSVLIGVLLVKIILITINTWEVSPSMVLMFGDSLDWKGIFVSVVVVSVIGLAIILITLRRQLRKEIISVIRRE